MIGWLASAEHMEWLRGQEQALLNFPTRIASDEGDAFVPGHDGRPIPGEVAPTFGAARVAHVYALAALRGRPGARPVAARLLAGLAAGGSGSWPESRGSDEDAPQTLYTLAFVILAAASGVALEGRAHRPLLDAALARLSGAFWEPEHGLGVDQVGTRPGPTPSYRGLNANMHLTEALLAASEVLGDPRWSAMALGICRFVMEQAAERDWRICEHYDAHWNPLPDFNHDALDDPFKPYGATVGHGYEWARLIASSARLAGSRAGEHLQAAASLFARATADGWNADGASGFLYTTDWQGRPASRQRLHWVAAEATAAAAVLHRVTGAEEYGAFYETWWDHISTSFIDHESGSWHHRLDPDGTPASAGKAAKPDLYHAYQATLIPQLPVAPSMVGAVRSATARR